MYLPYPFTTDMRLDIEDPSLLGAGQAFNLIRNPDGALGGWGWVTPDAGALFTTSGAPGTWLTYLSSSSVGSYCFSEAAPATGLVNYSASWEHRYSDWHRGTVQFLGADGTVIGEIPGPVVGNASASPVTTTMNANTAPAGTVQVRLKITMYGDAAGNPPSGLGTVRIEFRARLGQASAAVKVIEPLYTNILTSATGVEIEREPLSVGTLTASVPDALYDLSLNTLLRPGRRCRVIAAVGVDEPIFVGKIDTATVKYDPKRLDKKRAQINLTAVDPAADLANVIRPDGVAQVVGLKGVLEGAGIPWRINGDTAQGPPQAVVTRNESASALDQVAVTRDSVQGFAWLDRRGVLVASNAASMPTDPAATLGEGDYGDDIDVSFDLDTIINVVTIRLLRVNAATGQTVEIPYGPYRDEQSIADWGARSAEFTVQGLPETAEAMKAYADAVLARAAVPAVRVNSLTIRIDDPSDVTSERALLDLYDMVQVLVPTVDLDQSPRITKIKHRITPKSWLVDLTFARDGGVAPPQATPSVQSTGGVSPAAPSLQRGLEDSGAFTVGTSKAIPVVFPVPFATVPHVFAQVRSSSSDQFSAVTVSGHTTTGCVLNVTRTSSSAAVTLSWLAVV